MQVRWTMAVNPHLAVLIAPCSVRLASITMTTHLQYDQQIQRRSNESATAPPLVILLEF
jgi:hypothetical protein